MKPPSSGLPASWLPVSVDITEVRRTPAACCGPILQCVFRLPGCDPKARQILALGHSDTVYPIGTLQRMPFRERDGKLWGPGVFDMKAGIAFFIFAIRTLLDLGRPVRRPVLLQLNPDEEVGSDCSRALTEDEARKSEAVLVLEPGQDADGKLKTARKGVGDYTVSVRGRASHAGVDFSAGANAILELARQIEQISRFTDLDRGVTVNTGVISGGSRSNVVADFAQAEVDIRIPRLKDARELDERFRSLTPFDSRCSISITGGLNRPPMERTEAIGQLFEKARLLAADLGADLKEASTGGGSDGNFTAAVGTPTLDGIGAVGAGAHSPEEHIRIDRIADRTALIAKLLEAI
jgi:glutamate carboxypeptidase